MHCRRPFDGWPPIGPTREKSPDALPYWSETGRATLSYCAAGGENYYIIIKYHKTPSHINFIIGKQIKSGIF